MIAETIIASVIAGTSVCSDHFENTSRYNPTDLSDYQMCVHTVHGNEAGTVGKNVWFQIEGQFYYVPMQELADKSTDEIKAVVIETVVDTAVADELEEAKAQLQVLEDLNIDNEALIQSLNDKIDGLTEITEYTNTVSNSVHARINYRIHLGTPYIANSGAVIEIAVGTEVISITAGHYISTLSSSVLRQVAQTVANAYNTGYDDGYDAGYRDGYVAGYNQAVTDLNS